jgi:hypothetical protein
LTSVRDAHIASGNSPSNAELTKGCILDEADIRTLAGDASVPGVGLSHALAGAGTVSVTSIPDAMIINGRAAAVQNRQGGLSRTSRREAPFSQWPALVP